MRPEYDSATPPRKGVLEECGPPKAVVVSPYLSVPHPDMFWQATILRATLLLSAHDYA